MRREHFRDQLPQIAGAHRIAVGHAADARRALQRRSIGVRQGARL